MESLSKIDLGSQLLSIVMAAGLVAFALLIFRILIGTVKIISKNIKAKFNNASASENKAIDYQSKK